MVVYSNWRMSQSIIETVLMTENIRNVAVIEIIFGGIKGWQNLAVSSMMCLLFLLGNTIIPVDHVFLNYQPDEQLSAAAAEVGIPMQTAICFRSFLFLMHDYL